MKTPKRIFIWISFIFLIVLSGCRQEASSGKLTIVTSFYPVYVAAANVVDGAHDVELVNLTKTATGCLHDYQLTPQDMITLEGADVLVVNGAGMEPFLDKVANNYPDLNVIVASEGINLINGGSHHDEHSHNHHEESNSHVWVSITNYITYVQNIADQLSEYDRQNADRYAQNTQQYIERLTALKAKMHEALNAVENKEIITFHEAFPYFAEEFGLHVAAVIAQEPGTESKPDDLANIINVIRESGCSALFVEPQYSSDTALTIAGETGATVYTLDPIVTGDMKKEAYEEAMENNLQTLLEALQ